MATISYVNHDLPVGGKSFNPGIEEVLDTTPAVSNYTSNLYEMVNNNGGQFNGFKVQFLSNVNGGVGDFSYTNVGAELKPSGTITGMFLRAPDGTVIAQVLSGANGFGNAKLQDFYATLQNPAFQTPGKAISAALNSLFGNADVIFGSPVADHLTNFGYGVGQMNAGAGNDILTSSGSATMAGEAGNDVLRVSYGTYNVHGANADGSGGTDETNTLEVRGSADNSASVTIAKVTDIDILRFVDTDPAGSSADDSASLRTYFSAGDIKPGGLSSTLKVLGSEAASPFSENGIDIRADYAATKGASIDLSRWTFANWDADDSYISINTSTKLALADVVIGGKMSDSIYTGAGNDTIRGGGSADYLSGGAGSDTFVFGAHEAARGEEISEYSNDAGTDRILVLGDNDFSEAGFYGIEIVAFGGTATATFNQFIVGDESSLAIVQGDSHANTLAIKVINYGYGPPAVDLSDLAFKSWAPGVDKVKISGTKAADSIAGSIQGDVINGGIGNDDLQGNAGADAFVFDLGRGNGVDHIADFQRKQGDMLHLELDVFKKLKSATKGSGLLKKAAFEIGDEADSKKDRILYDRKDGTLRYDDDGTGKHKAHIIAILDDAAGLKAGDILVI